MRAKETFVLNSQTSSKWFGLPVMFYAALHHYHNKILISAIFILIWIQIFKSEIWKAIYVVLEDI
jgi:hypothetical protein